jgi:2',3'-cyclic-nucleotide 2'-phosphodiesterase (5'-nucleotidase family)
MHGPSKYWRHLKVRALVLTWLTVSSTPACTSEPRHQPAVGRLETSLSARRRDLSSAEQPLGDLLADAIAAQAAPVDLALVPAGVFGFDRLRFRSGLIPQGPVDRTALGALVLFNDPMVVSTLTGEQLHALLARCFAEYPEPSRFFVQVSRALAVVLEPATPTVLRSISVGGEPLADDKTYRVASVSSLFAENGIDTAPVAVGTRLRDALVAYVQAHPDVSGRTSGRIVVTPAKADALRATR